MTSTFDVIVLGAGAMGVAAAYQVAQAGQRTLLLEQFEIDHQKGSSYGTSRIIRYAYDYPQYIALAKAAFPAWRALEDEAGEQFYFKTGGLDFGVPGETSLENTFTSLKTAGIAYEELTPAEAHHRFPQFRFGEDWKICYQADSGFVTASKGVQAHVRLAQKHGAIVLANTPVVKITPHATSVEVQTASATYTAGKIIIAAGAWLKSLLTPLGLDLPLRPLRTQEIYFHAEPNADYEPARFPVYIAHVLSLYNNTFYGLPSFNNSGVKTGLHGGNYVNHPSEMDYTPDPQIIERVRAFTREHLPAAQTVASARVCLYTMTPDEHFIIDQHPQHPHIIFAGGCSGHAYKFSPVIGEILRDLALDGTTRHDISLFNASRFVAV